MTPPCDLCGIPDLPLVYHDPTNRRFLCRDCYPIWTDPMATRKKSSEQTALVKPDGPAVVELFASYEAARAASIEVAPWAAEILAVTQVDGAAQLQWAAERGVECHTRLKAEEAAQAAELAPVKAIEKTIKSYRAPTIAQLKQCKAHLDAIIREGKDRAAAAAAFSMSHVTNETERAEALALVVPRIEGHVEVETWMWELVDAALIPHEYFILDEARLTREARELKAAFAVPGFKNVRGTRGHFRS